jgi:hypothetical protein
MGNPENKPGHRIGSTHAPYEGTCYEHNDKRLYRSRKDARHAAKTNRIKGLSSYKCDARPGYWHVGHLLPEIKAGKLSRDEMREKPWKLKAIRDHEEKLARRVS